ncbi:hypothetical protein HW555_014208 [Spodoptera exigua]|uniref:DUF6570 domain-containing protein n=1 Tax=Spodoptera exigua TaxID=7107 RepID=A0A835G466_SPOEX|nr:hypothetical protein HW555_014208 [Spodoptera exigua]
MNTVKEREERLLAMKNYTNLRLRQETLEQREFRNAKIKKRLANETSEQRAHRLDNESPEQRAHRLGIIHNRLANESAQEREKRLTTMRQSSQRQRSMIERNFINTINQYTEEPCTVCKKILYPKQKMVLVPTRFEFLPQEVAVLEKNIVCSRCSTTIKKRKVPSQAYWNNMEVISLPPELADLTDVEQRLLSRVVPFMKIIKLQNRFSQSWCRGQVILFAQDVVEAAEQLPLPLAQAGIVVLFETRDNLPNHKQFQVDIRKIKITFQGSCVNLNIAHDLSINGHFSRDQEGYPNLENGIASFFDNNYTCGILTANFISILMPEGPKGHKGRTGGVSCCLRFENSRQIAALLRCNLKATGLPEYILNIYSITPVFVVESGGYTRIESQHSERNLNRDRRLILSTSMLYDIDENIPNLDRVIESDNRNLNENRVTDIHRKTAPPVNIERERRMEELYWYTMYPDGKNGFETNSSLLQTEMSKEADQPTGYQCKKDIEMSLDEFNSPSGPVQDGLLNDEVHQKKMLPCEALAVPSTSYNTSYCSTPTESRTLAEIISSVKLDHRYVNTPQSSKNKLERVKRALKMSQARIKVLSQNMKPGEKRFIDPIVKFYPIKKNNEVKERVNRTHKFVGLVVGGSVCYAAGHGFDSHSAV